MPNQKHVPSCVWHQCTVCSVHLITHKGGILLPQFRLSQSIMTFCNMKMVTSLIFVVHGTTKMCLIQTVLNEAQRWMNANINLSFFMFFFQWDFGLCPFCRLYCYCNSYKWQSSLDCHFQFGLPFHTALTFPLLFHCYNLPRQNRAIKVEMFHCCAYVAPLFHKGECTGATQVKQAGSVLFYSNDLLLWFR